MSEPTSYDYIRVLLEHGTLRSCGQCLVHLLFTPFIFRFTNPMAENQIWSVETDNSMNLYSFSWERSFKGLCTDVNPDCPFTTLFQHEHNSFHVTAAPQVLSLLFAIRAPRNKSVSEMRKYFEKEWMTTKLPVSMAKIRQSNRLCKGSSRSNRTAKINVFQPKCESNAKCRSCRELQFI